MILLGSIVNGVGVALGALAGMALKSKISAELKDFWMQGMGLCVLYIGYSGTMATQKTLVMILSIFLGGAIGHLLDLNGKIEALGAWIQDRMGAAPSDASGGHSIQEGFVSCSLIICVGAMAIVGSMQSGISNQHEILLAKAMIDSVIAIVMGATLGFGVVLSGAAVFAYEAILTVASSWIGNCLTEAVIIEMGGTGSLIILAIGLNLLKLTNIKTANLIPATFLPILLCRLIP